MPGSLGSWVGVDRKTPIVTLELPRGAERLSADDANLSEAQRETLMAAVRSVDQAGQALTELSRELPRSAPAAKPRSYRFKRGCPMLPRRPKVPGLQRIHYPAGGYLPWPDELELPVSCSVCAC